MTRRGARWLGVLLLLAAWQALALASSSPSIAVISPADVARAIREVAARGLPPGNALAGHVVHSLGRVLLGFGAAALVGVPLGFASARSARAGGPVRALVDLLRPIPPLAWVPLAIGWFGIGLGAAGFVIFLGAVFPIVVSTCGGVTAVPAAYLDVARSFDARPHQIWLGVLIPAALPAIVTGLRVALGVAWMTLVAAEFTDVRAGYGLGYLLTAARDLQRMDVVIGAMACIGAVGWLLDFGLRHAARFLRRDPRAS